jgi:hypothetical protein
MAHVVLGHAHRSAGNPDMATLEWRSAQACFESYGAPLHLADVDALLGTTRSDVVQKVATLAQIADGWRVGIGDRETTLRDLKGIHLLARLLASPGREIDVLDLAGAGTIERGLPALDDEAKANYRRRLVEVDDDIAEAERNNDPARAALAERDRQYLINELGRAVGLGGRTRLTGDTTERARTSVTRTLRYAIVRISEDLPGLGAHLEHSVRTGVRCMYRPDPLSPIVWHLEL